MEKKMKVLAVNPKNSLGLLKVYSQMVIVDLSTIHNPEFCISRETFVRTVKSVEEGIEGIRG